MFATDSAISRSVRTSTNFDFSQYNRCCTFILEQFWSVQDVALPTRPLNIANPNTYLTICLFYELYSRWAQYDPKVRCGWGLNLFNSPLSKQSPVARFDMFWNGIWTRRRDPFIIDNNHKLRFRRVEDYCGLYSWPFWCLRFGRNYGHEEPAGANAPHKNLVPRPQCTVALALA